LLKEQSFQLGKQSATKNLEPILWVPFLLLLYFKAATNIPNTKQMTPAIPKARARLFKTFFGG